MAGRREVHLVRPARERRHEGDPAVVAEHRALAALLPFDDIAVQAPSCLPHVTSLGCQLTLNGRRHKGVRVDLPVRMAEGDPDRLTTILEDEYVAHVGQAAKLVGAITPDLDQVLYVIDGLLTQR